MAAAPYLSVEGLTKHFKVKSGIGSSLGIVKAVDDVSFDVERGEVVGIVGESGCGKSTLARLLMGLIPVDRGELRLQGQPLQMQGRSLLTLRRKMQMVFQDSHASFDPQRTVIDAISFAPRVHGKPRAAAHAAAESLLGLVGLDPALFRGRYPHELSGGQRQRVNIARALALQPEILILDESVSALDKSVEAQILNLLKQIKTSLSLTYLFISHDLNVVEYVSDRILVMYLGQLVETGPVEQVYSQPRHPYTRALLASKPSLDPRRPTAAAALSGDPPSPLNPPSGCRFRTRCAHAESVCAARAPTLGADDGDAHRVACLMYEPGSGHSLAA
ncbi:MAG: ABC transporter ATP-binding protein [Burkholderiaceae bacterium]